MKKVLVIFTLLTTNIVLSSNKIPATQADYSRSTLKPEAKPYIPLKVKNSKLNPNAPEFHPVNRR